MLLILFKSKGKIGVILESDKTIDVLCLEKEDSRIVLYVEPLKV